MVEHESVDPKAQGKPDLGTGVTNQVRCWGLVAVRTAWGGEGKVCVGESGGVRSGVCEVVVGENALR